MSLVRSDNLDKEKRFLWLGFLSMSRRDVAPGANAQEMSDVNQNLSYSFRLGISSDVEVLYMT